MNQVILEDFITITASILSLSVAIGLMLGMVLQPHQESANGWFALFLSSLALWGGAALLLTLPGLAHHLDLTTIFYLYLVGLGLIPVTFYFAAVAFCGIRTLLTRAIALLTPVLLVVFLILLWNDRLFILEVTPSADSIAFSALVDSVHITPVGTAAIVLSAGYLLLALALIWRRRGERSRLLRIPALLLSIGSLGNLVGPLSRTPFDAILTTLAAGLIGYVLIRVQVFDPLTTMNRQLTDANQELRSLIKDLAAEKERADALNAELRTVSQYKSEFLATMSHELRTPLNSIVGYSELLLQGLYGDLNERQSDRLEKILRNGQALLALINNILDLSKIEAGRMDFTFQQVALSDTVESVAPEFTSAAAAKGLQLEIQVAPDLYAVYGDAQRIQQILHNLLSNAVKFTPQGSVRLEVFNTQVKNGYSRTLTLPAPGWLKDGNWVIIRVTDTGIGIAPEDHDRIFDEFRQLDSSATREFGGTGLGLAITKKLVALHSGAIWLTSAPGQGSTFYVALPASSRAISETRPQPETGLSQEQPHILVIDDNQEALDILTAFLTEAGYRVTQAGDGATGLELARQLQPDVITTDLMMPGITGWELIEQLKSNPVTATIPIVTVSIVDSQPLGLWPAVDAHISKPIQREALLEAIARLLTGQPGDRPILIVDDDPSARQLVADVLSSAGHASVAVDSGQAAMDWLAHNRASAVVLDLLMPDINGFQVLEHIRQQEYLADLPVLVVTAKTLSAQERIFLQQHLATLVRKQGLQRSDLLALIEQALGGASDDRPAGTIQ